MMLANKVKPLNGLPADAGSLRFSRKVALTQTRRSLRERLKQGSLLPPFGAMLGCTHEPKRPDKPARCDLVADSEW